MEMIKMELNLYYNPKEQVYYYYNDDKTCDNCFNPFFDVVLVKVVWDKFGSGVQYFCKNCRNNFQENTKATYIERFVGVLTNNISRNCEIVLLSKPVLKPVSDVSVFDTNSIQSDRVVDKTVYSNRPSLPVKEYVIDDGKDKVLNDLALDKFLLDVKSSVPALEFEKQKQLRDGSLDSD